MRFDDAAATWDEDPIRLKRAEQLALRIRPIIKKYQLKEGLDFGCGTGLVSFQLMDDLEKITLLDVSEGMIGEAHKKIQKLGAPHLQAHVADLTRTHWTERYDLIYTLLTLHHIQDVPALLSTFAGMLRPGGFLCIADLDQEDGSFHEEYPDFDGHNGFDQEELMTWMAEAGFSNFQTAYFFEIEKNLASGEKRKYPLFLLTARRGA